MRLAQDRINNLKAPTYLDTARLVAADRTLKLREEARRFELQKQRWVRKLDSRSRSSSRLNARQARTADGGARRRSGDGGGAGPEAAPAALFDHDGKVSEPEQRLKFSSSAPQLQPLR